MKDFLYPDYGVSVKAETQEEADKKLQEILNPKPAKKNEPSPQA